MQNKSSIKEKDEMKQKKTWLLPVFVILVTLIIGGVLSFGFTSGKVQAFVKDFGEEKDVETTVPLTEFLINLASEKNKREQFLKIELSVYSTEKDSQELIEAKMPQIRDAAISVLRKQTADTIFGADQELKGLKEALITQINQTLGKPIIKNVFITNIVMQ